jgi:sugar transferase EpsL
MTRFLACLLLLALLPVLLPLAVLIALVLGRPILFTQHRPGLRGIPFRLHKFRTMTTAVFPDGTPLPDAQRLTRFGRFLRSTSLDELPELLNIIRGEMAFVGPRPLLIQYLPLYTPEQARRHEVLPGVTGWAQINGRNAISWEEKFALDVWYVEHRSLWLDIRILLLTVAKVIRREGVSAVGEATARPFTGSPPSPPPAPP